MSYTTFCRANLFLDRQYVHHGKQYSFWIFLPLIIADCYNNCSMFFLSIIPEMLKSKRICGNTVLTVWKISSPMTHSKILKKAVGTIMINKDKGRESSQKCKWQTEQTMDYSAVRRNVSLGQCHTHSLVGVLKKCHYFSFIIYYFLFSLSRHPCCFNCCLDELATI